MRCTILRLRTAVIPNKKVGIVAGTQNRSRFHIPYYAAHCFSGSLYRAGYVAFRSSIIRR